VSLQSSRKPRPRADTAAPIPRLLAQLLLAAQLVIPAAVGAAVPTTVGPIVITVPDGFQPAQTQRLKKALVSAWTKSVRDGSMKTLLQINVVDFGAPAASQHVSIYAEKYLRQFLGGIERRRSRYVSSPVAHVTLAGLPAVRATWNGALGDREVVGVMYSVIVQNRFAVIFHTQDLGSMPTSGMLEAMQAIESVSLAGIS
jgi:hypothetical protein